MPTALGLNTLRISHQDGLLQFTLENGGYYIENGRLTISIKTRAIKSDQFPSCALFCLTGFPLDGPLRLGEVFDCKRDEDTEEEDGLPQCFAYFTFHAERVEVHFKVEEIRPTSIVFSLTASHDDVDYYDERAKRTPTVGLFELREAQPGQLWIPS